jgi:hypothetical protein
VKDVVVCELGNFSSVGSATERRSCGAEGVHLKTERRPTCCGIPCGQCYLLAGAIRMIWIGFLPAYCMVKYILQYSQVSIKD